MALADGHSKDIVDTAVGAGSFTTLVAAVQAAGLVIHSRVKVHSQYLHPQMKHLQHYQRALLLLYCCLKTKSN